MTENFIQTLDSTHVLSWITLSPLLGVLAILFAPKGKGDVVKTLAVAFTGIPLVLAVYMYFFQFQTGQGGGYQLYEHFSWVKAFNIEYAVGVDGLSAPLILLNCIIF